MRSFRCPAVYDGGSHSPSRSIFMNSSTVSWLVGVSSNSVSLEQEGPWREPPGAPATLGYEPSSPWPTAGPQGGKAMHTGRSHGETQRRPRRKEAKPAALGSRQLELNHVSCDLRDV